MPCKFARGDLLRCPGSNDRWISTGTALRKFSEAGLKEFGRLRPGAASRQVPCADVKACAVGEPATTANMASTVGHWDASRSSKAPASPSAGTCDFEKGEVVRCKNTGLVYLGTGTALRKFSAEGWKLVQSKRPGLKFRDASCSNIAACKAGEPATSANLASNLALIDAGPMAVKTSASSPATAAPPFTSTPATVAPTPIPSLKPLPPFGRFVSLTSVENLGRSTDIKIDNSQRNTSNIGNMSGAAEAQNDYFNAVLLALLAMKRAVAPATGPTTPDGLVMINPPASASQFAEVAISGPVAETSPPEESQPPSSPFPFSLPPSAPAPSKTALYAASALVAVAAAASARFLATDRTRPAAISAVVAACAAVVVAQL